MLIYDIFKCISKPYDVLQPENLFSVDPHNLYRGQSVQRYNSMIHRKPSQLHSLSLI